MHLEYGVILTSIIAFTGAVVWMVRLEGKVNNNEKSVDNAQKDIDALRIKHESLDSKVVQELITIRESLARIEGRLDAQRDKHGS
jgi:hypothetical protein